MTRRQFRSALITAALLVALTLLGLGVRFLRFVEYEAEVGYRGEARSNPLLAAERTLGGLGREVRSTPALGPLPPTDALLVLRQSGRFLSPVAIQRLLDWSSKGGHLVLLFPGDAAFLEQIEDDLEQGRFQFPLVEAFGVHARLDDAPEGLVELDLGGGAREIALPGRIAFEDELGLADVVVGESLRARVLSFERELGRVTLFADDTWATNGELGSYDHAYVLAELASFDGERDDVRLVFGESPPGLLSLLWRHGWTAVIALSVLVALALRRQGFALGPRLPELPRDRRDFSEHVAAAGEFLWRTGESRALLAAPHAELRRKLALARPDLTELASPELAEALAHSSGLETARVRTALDTQETQDPERFSSVVRDLETLRRSL